ncbi:MAG: hypothetical protein KDB07_00485 [Planctomycetes bacterium]|nr:hypothetical protein [Planctomycetota bacterium]
MQFLFVRRLAVAGVVLALLAGFALLEPRTALADDDVKDIYIIINADPTDAKTFADEPGDATLKRIFLKEDKTWSDGTEFYVVAQTGNAEFSIFRKKVLDKTEEQLAKHWSDKDSVDGTKPPKTVKTSADVFKYVSKKKEAIGYISKSYYSNTLTEDEKKKIKTIKTISK